MAGNGAFPANYLAIVHHLAAGWLILTASLKQRESLASSRGAMEGTKEGACSSF